MFDDDPSNWNASRLGPSLGRGSKAGILASTLAWAVRHGIAFDAVLATLTEHVHAGGGAWGSKWRWQLQRVIQDLRHGVPLSRALRKRLSRFVSEHFLLAIEEAERTGRLAEVLPCFARRLELVADRELKLRTGLVYPALVFFHAFWIALGLCVFILPKFAHIVRELATECPDATMPWTYDILLGASRVFGSVNAWPLFVAFGGLLFIFRQQLWNMVEGALLPVPFVGQAIQQDVMLELAGGMSAILASGEDVARAGEFCQRATHRPWLKKRLSRFVTEIRAGKPWVDAWEELRLGTPLHNWMIRNAAARETPVEGFDSLLGWLTQEFSQTSHLLVRLAEITGVVMNGSIVFICTMTIFGFLTRLIHAMTTW